MWLVIRAKSVAAPATVSDLLGFNSTTGVGWEGGIQATNCEPGDLPLVSSPDREARRFPGTDSVCGDVAKSRLTALRNRRELVSETWMLGSVS